MTRLRLHTGIESTSGGRALVFRLEGDLDVLAAPLLRQLLARAAAESDTSVVVELEGLGSLDAWGLDALVRADDQARRAGRPLAFRSPPASARRLLELAGLDLSS